MNKSKLIVFCILIVSALFVASTAFADDVTTTEGAGKIDIGTNADAADLSIGLSKGVEVRYVNNVASRSLAQWYSVAAVHSGGNQGYGTAQNLTNIMKVAYNPGDATSTVLTIIPVTEASKDAWTTLGWTTQ